MRTSAPAGTETGAPVEQSGVYTTPQKGWSVVHSRVSGAGPLDPDVQSVEHEDSPGDLARIHRANRFVEVIEAASARDHFFEQEPPLARELEVAGDIDA